MTDAHRLAIHYKIRDFEVLTAEEVFYSIFKRRTLRHLFGRAEKTIHIENELMDRVPLTTAIKGVAEETRLIAVS